MKSSLNLKELRLLIEPWFHQYLSKRTYEIKYIEPYKLLNKSRFDIYSKLLFLEQIENDKNNYKDLYLSFIKAFTLGTFKEPGNEFKNNSDIYIKTFKDIFSSIKENGFNIKKSIIPVSKEGVILNGSHRLASLISLNLLVPIVEIDIKPPKFDYKFFRSRKVPIQFLDQCVIKEIEIKRKFRKDLKMAIVWPAADRNKLDLEKNIPNILYKKNIYFNFNGFHNLISCVYDHESWLGNINNGFLGARSKATLCYSDKNPLSVYLFEPSFTNDIVSFKESIRNEFGIKKSSIHINDNFEEILFLSDIFFNQNTIFFLNNVIFKNHSKKFLNQISCFKNFLKTNNINVSDVVIDGSMIISAFCIRDARDIDYLILPSLIKKRIYKEMNNINIHNDEFEKYSCLNLKSVIKDNRYFFTFRGIKFLTLEVLYSIKENRNEDKDKIDNLLIKSLLRFNLFEFLYANLSQRLTFFGLKLKNKIIIFLKYLKLYNFLKKISKNK